MGKYYEKKVATCMSTTNCVQNTLKKFTYVTTKLKSTFRQLAQIRTRNNCSKQKNKL